VRARRRHLAWGDRERALYASHRGRIEGVHGEAKSWRGLARAVRRGLNNMRIQAYLTAAVINLKAALRCTPAHTSSTGSKPAVPAPDVHLGVTASSFETAPVVSFTRQAGDPVRHFRGNLT
jgi:hypothetical protein